LVKFTSVEYLTATLQGSYSRPVVKRVIFLLKDNEDDGKLTNEWQFNCYWAISATATTPSFLIARDRCSTEDSETANKIHGLQIGHGRKLLIHLR